MAPIHSCTAEWWQFIIVRIHARGDAVSNLWVCPISWQPLVFHALFQALPRGNIGTLGATVHVVRGIIYDTGWEDQRRVSHQQKRDRVASSGGTTQLCHAASTHIAPVSLVSETTQLLEDIIIQHASLTCWQDVIQRASLT